MHVRLSHRACRTVLRDPQRDIIAVVLVTTTRGRARTRTHARTHARAYGNSVSRIGACVIPSRIWPWKLVASAVRARTRRLCAHKMSHARKRTETSVPCQTARLSVACRTAYGFAGKATVVNTHIHTHASRHTFTHTHAYGCRRRASRSSLHHETTVLTGGAAASATDAHHFGAVALFSRVLRIARGTPGREVKEPELRVWG
jgi:hypothetical protein